MPKIRSVLVLCDEYGQQQVVGADVVFEHDPEPIRVGLLDAQGNPLVRYREPIGFNLMKARS